MFFIMVKQDANNITNLIFTPVVMISETRNFTVIRLLYFQIIITKFSHVQTANKKSSIVLKKKDNFILNFSFSNFVLRDVIPFTLLVEK